ncbi:MAG: hypothetical protein IT428_11770 [Planctomycetaceae bacterium]|nr:hypothetical protein [Planctomycetaceae bacterium]
MTDSSDAPDSSGLLRRLRLPSAAAVTLVAVGLLLAGLVWSIVVQQRQVQSWRKRGLYVGLEMRQPHWLWKLLSENWRQGLDRVDGLEVRHPAIFTDADMEVVSQYSGLRYFSVPDGRITDDGLACLRRNDRLQVLRLAELPVTDEGMRHIATLSELTELYITDIPLTDHGLDLLSGLQSLRSVSFYGLKISDEGFRRFAAGKRFESVLLSNTAISDYGLEALRGMSSLKYIDLSNTRVTDDGLQILGSMPSLTMIVLTEAQFSPAAIESLQKKCHCELMLD